MLRREFLWTSTVTTLGLVASGGSLVACGSRGSVTLTASLQAIELSVSKKTLGNSAVR